MVPSNYNFDGVQRKLFLNIADVKEAIKGSHQPLELLFNLPVPGVSRLQIPSC